MEGTVAIFLQCPYVPSHPLASGDKLTYLDFTDYIEIVQGDIQNPSFTFEAQDASATGGNSKKTVSIYDRGSQFELLRQLPGSYMWTSPVPYGCLTSLRFDSKDMQLSRKHPQGPADLQKRIPLFQGRGGVSPVPFTDGKPSFRLTRRATYIKPVSPFIERLTGFSLP